MVVQLDQYQVSSEARLQQVLETALEKNCVIVGVHKVSLFPLLILTRLTRSQTFTSYPTLPVFALVPIARKSEHDAALSFASFTFEPAKGKAIGMVSISTGQPDCDVGGIVSGLDFLPQYLSCGKATPGEQHSTHTLQTSPMIDS